MNDIVIRNSVTISMSRFLPGQDNTQVIARDFEYLQKCKIPIKNDEQKISNILKSGKLETCDGDCCNEYSKISSLGEHGDRWQCWCPC